MAFLDLVSQLTGELPGLSPLLAQKHINWAWRDIRQMRLWSFLSLDGAVVCPAQVTAGAVSITQYTDTVTLDATASAALLAQTAVGAVPGIQNLSIRFGATSPVAGQVYNIINFDASVPAAIVLTLNRVVLEATNATSGYQCYRAYIVPPMADFLGWESLNDMANAFSMTHENGRLSHTSKYFDLRDPQRTAQGLAYFLGAYAGAYQSDPIANTVIPVATVDPGVNIYELWPHPTSGQTFYARFRRRGADFAQQNEAQPDVIPDAMILERAKATYSYPFAAANVGNFPTFKGVAWQSLIAVSKANFKDALLLAKKNDDEAALQTVYARGHGLRTGTWDFKGLNAFPIDSNFMQSHLVRF
jgi:hypothetical protein